MHLDILGVAMRLDSLRALILTIYCSALCQPLAAQDLHCSELGVFTSVASDWANTPGLQGFSREEMTGVINIAIELRPHEALRLLQQSAAAMQTASLAMQKTPGFSRDLSSSERDRILDQLVLTEFPGILEQTNRTLGPEDSSLPKATPIGSGVRPSRFTAKEMIVSSKLFDRIPSANFDVNGRSRLLTALRKELTSALPRATPPEIEQLLKELNGIISQQKQREDELDDQATDSGSSSFSDSYDFAFEFQKFFEKRRIPVRIDFGNRP
jgi:hypothetical protein